MGDKRKNMGEGETPPAKGRPGLKPATVPSPIAGEAPQRPVMSVAVEDPKRKNMGVQPRCSGGSGHSSCRRDASDGVQRDGASRRRCRRRRRVRVRFLHRLGRVRGLRQELLPGYPIQQHQGGVPVQKVRLRELLGLPRAGLCL